MLQVSVGTLQRADCSHIEANICRAAVPGCRYWRLQCASARSSQWDPPASQDVARRMQRRSVRAAQHLGAASCTQRQPPREKTHRAQVRRLSACQHHPCHFQAIKQGPSLLGPCLRLTSGWSPSSPASPHLQPRPTRVTKALVILSPAPSPAVETQVVLACWQCGACFGHPPSSDLQAGGGSQRRCRAQATRPARRSARSRLR